MLWQGNLQTRVRIYSGLFLFAYAFFHFLNLGLGLVSPEAMDAMQEARQWLIRNPLGSVALYGALFAHAGVALWDLANRRSLRLPPVQFVQTALGVMIPLQLIAHVVFTRYAHDIYNVNDEYGYLILLMWGNASIWWQSGLLVVVWIHGCIGLHYWLRLTRWWQRATPWLIGGAVLVPFFALTGLLFEGRRLQDLVWIEGMGPELYESYNWPNAEDYAALYATYMTWTNAFWLLLGLLLATYVIRRVLRRQKSVRISYRDGLQIDGEKGMTLLEMSQAQGIPHTALCGGKGRCTTCRVVIEDGLEHLSPPQETEARSLRAVKAAPNVRLACQIRPDTPLTVYRVFRPEGTRHRAHASQGEERQLALLFLDMRGFTNRTAGLLPYDVVFLLNRFFDAIVPEITAAGGHVDKYMGDGLLALFEAPSAESSARAGLRAVAAIGQALERFNHTLSQEGEAQVRIGMGLHLGQVVLGEIGSANNAPRTIIGSTVNTASRLEAATKELGVQLLVSEALLQATNLDLEAVPLQDFALRGVSGRVRAWPVDEAQTVSVLSPA